MSQGNQQFLVVLHTVQNSSAWYHGLKLALGGAASV